MKESYFKTSITRKQYWARIIISWIGISILAGIATAITGAEKTPYPFVLAMWIYFIIIQTKRLRDANKSFLFLLLDLLTIVGIIVIGCFPSDPAGNRSVETNTDVWVRK